MLLKTLETDAADAAWRTAGKQFVRLAKEPLVAMLQKHIAPEDPSMKARLAALLDSELGEAMLAALLSVGLGSLPSPVASEVGARLSRELRVNAMATATNVVADVLMEPLRQVAVLYLQGAQTAAAQALPEATAGLAIPTEAAAPVAVGTPEK